MKDPNYYKKLEVHKIPLNPHELTPFLRYA